MEEARKKKRKKRKRRSVESDVCAALSFRRLPAGRQAGRNPEDISKNLDPGIRRDDTGSEPPI